MRRNAWPTIALRTHAVSPRVPSGYRFRECVGRLSTRSRRRHRRRQARARRRRMRSSTPGSGGPDRDHRQHTTTSAAAGRLPHWGRSPTSTFGPRGQASLGRHRCERRYRTSRPRQASASRSAAERPRQIVAAHVLDDADDFGEDCPGCRWAPTCSRLPTAFSPGHARAASVSSMTMRVLLRRVVLVEEASGQHPRAHRAEVAGRDVAAIGRLALPVARGRLVVGERRERRRCR